MTSRISAAGGRRPVRPIFIFWGRIHAQKGLPRALKLFALVRDIVNSAQFIVIGPDGGELALVQQLSRDLGVEEAVKFLGPMDFDNIMLHALNASFYLQTSELEGMAMSVVEAMQLGLVPVVTPAGEIANYCRHGTNAIIVDDDEEALKVILTLLRNEKKYENIRSNAIATWLKYPLYKDCVLQACRDILRMDANDPKYL